MYMNKQQKHMRQRASVTSGRRRGKTRTAIRSGRNGAPLSGGTTCAMVLVQWALLQEEQRRKQEQHRKRRNGTRKKNVENKGAATEQVALNKWCQPTFDLLVLTQKCQGIFIFPESVKQILRLHRPH